MVPEPGLDAEARSAETRQARRAQPTRMSVGSGDFEPNQKARREQCPARHEKLMAGGVEINRDLGR